MHHLEHDRSTNSRPYAQKCSHGHMYLVLETFRRSKSPTRLSCRWSRIVRQLSDAPPRTRSTDKFPSRRTKRSHGHMYLVLDTFRRAISPTRLSCRWRRIVRQLSHAPPRTRSTDKFPSLRMEMCPRTHVPRARDLPLCEVAHLVRWRLVRPVTVMQETSQRN